ncbi:MAG: prepilin peptidase [Armatimonadetes bacterium CG07_land_8_20_14_0_80_59_28]|nr:MAG: prepilin peptidase [Armatimonadetes bacterium CG07_land_8_20_14_0_80_59_28]PIX45998.1 MAG: prepilin peptidase [Armatimonadetes bacterium CG_4_8_14_3_um_filter_58_9]PIY41963.1 MAG: prepilin peptidase [Armatimonadetes bacterium CG_4_10_14_3_um_filter_59_10]
MVGSFLNVCICRMPFGESVVSTPSHCPFCNTRLRVPDLFPLFSLIWLRARCRYCKQPVSWRYFVVELITGILFVLTGLNADSLLQLGANVVLVSSLIAILYIDLDHYIIPDELSLTPAAVGLGVDLYRLTFLHTLPPQIPVPWFGGGIQVPVPGSVLGLVVGSGVLLFVGWVGAKMFHKESMGGGDVKLAGTVGTYFGLSWHLLTFFLVSIILGAAVGITLIALKRKSGRDYMPFGPMLVVGAIVVLLWGDVVTPMVVNMYSIN